MKDVRPKLGEGVAWNLLEKNLPGDVVCYSHRIVESYESDILILIPERGLFVLEIKSWYPENVRIDSLRRIFLKDEKEETENPRTQAKRYRDHIYNFFKKKKNINPLVVPLVCYTNMTQAQYENCKLNYISEPEDTIFSDELRNPERLMEKFNQAYVRMFNESLNKMDSKTISVIRSAFEPDYNEVVQPPLIKQPPYSAIYFLKKITNQTEILSRYFYGTKIIIFTSDLSGSQNLIEKIEKKYYERGILRDGMNLKFDAIPDNHFKLKNNEFCVFNFSLYLLPPQKHEDFCIEDGKIKNNEAFLEEMQKQTSFNYEQYKIEHAPKKDIAVKAGAGTGKTYSMVSRVGFLFHTDISQPEKMSDGIVMLTFTNEAAENMRNRLKRYFMNYYILTNWPKYLDAIADIELMQISTIHKFANKVIRNSVISLGLGHQYTITNSKFLKEKEYTRCLSEYICGKSNEDQNFVSNLSLQPYQLVDVLLKISKRLYNKGIDVEKLTPDQLGESVSSLPYFNEIIIKVLQKAERNLKEKGIKNNELGLDHTMLYFKNAINSESFNSNSYSYRYVFIDEFQDTDDTQIEIFSSLKKKIGFHLFVVGDLKQSIYRFRGATLDAFNKLKAETGDSSWAPDYDLRINYRTDSRLLSKFDEIFRKIGSHKIGGSDLLPYDNNSVLLSHIQSPNIANDQVFQFKKFSKEIKGSQFDELAKIITSQKRALESNLEHENLSLPKRSIAILVRRNDQVRTVMKELGERGIAVESVGSGDLYKSAPARDLGILLSALCFPRDRHYLYSLITSNNVHTDFSLQKISGLDREQQLQAMTIALNQFYMMRMDQTWLKIVEMCNEKPILLVLKNIYDQTKPWNNKYMTPIEQIEYQNNADLLIELMIQHYSVESLTLQVMREFIVNNILTGFEQQARKTEIVDQGVHITCLTIHKSKGLEFAYVDMPYMQDRIDNSISNKTNVIVLNDEIGYFIQNFGHNSFYQENEENLQKSKEEARILYVAMTRAISSFVWMADDKIDEGFTWASMIKNRGEVNGY